MRVGNCGMEQGDQSCLTGKGAAELALGEGSLFDTVRAAVEFSDERLARERRRTDEQGDGDLDGLDPFDDFAMASFGLRLVLANLDEFLAKRIGPLSKSQSSGLGSLKPPKLRPMNWRLFSKRGFYLHSTRL